MPESGGIYYDRQEVRAAAEREQAMFHALPGLIRHALDNAPFFTRHLAGIDPDEVGDRAALARLPVVRKSDLAEQQQAERPFGGLMATPIGRLARIFASPGPIYDPEGVRHDYWRFARAMFAAGFRSGEIVHNSFSYHLTPAGSMAEGGARALGCPVIPGGTGHTEQQARIIADVRPAAYVGTPSFLLILLEKGRELGLDMGSITKALVSGEAFPPAQRERLKAGFGIDACQCYATADLGLVAYESNARDGLIVDESIIVEIVRPGTGDPVPEGEVGEIVVTAFNPDYPLVRFATGDLSAVLPGESPCGRTNMRIRGWMGRADQATKVRGMFVQPRQIAELLRRHPEAARARLIVEAADGKDRMRLVCEVARQPEGLASAIAESVRGITGMRAEVELVAPGSLPNDGKVIDDRRAVT
ncbi:AMP-binding protein [Geminicoccaceae bacterium 1502E]|nr:AMP-binding protein [Geminicoccaceae bacterium 1502E]